MKVVDPSDIAMKIITENKGKVLSITGTISGSQILVSAGTFIARMKVDSITGLKKGVKIQIDPSTLEITKV